MAAIKQLKLLDNTIVDIKDEISGYQTAADVQTAISVKQNTLVSGENIKTINGHDLLGNGNIQLDIPANVSDLNNDSGFQTQTQVEALIVDELGRFDKLDYEIVTTLPATGTAGVRYLIKHPTYDRYEEYIYVNNQWYDIGSTDEVNLTDYYTKEETNLLLDDKVNYTDHATSTDYGLVKLNPNESVSVNASGQLTVGGRLGQYPDGGVYYPQNIEPSGVGSSSFLMTDGAKGIKIAGRTFAIMAGANITCKSAAAGSTQYRVSNTQGNRFACAAVAFNGGRAALNQADAAENGTALITSIKFANGNNISAYFGPNESDNDIIITLSRTVNPNAATTSIRCYGTNSQGDNILVGQGVGAGGGKVISLGQSTYASGNQALAFGNSVHVMANNSAGFGHTILINKQYCLGAGQGHDFTNASNGTTAVGTWSQLNSTTKFAVGNGTAYDNRSNIFEVVTVGSQTGLIMKSPNGTKYRITVDDSGNLTTTAVS